MAAGSFGVDLAGLAEATTGIQGVLAELGKLGMHGQETSGSPIEDLALDADAVGRQDLADALAELCGRGHYAARAILGSAQDTVTRLTDTRSNYQKVEGAVTGMLHRIVNDMAGNPVQAMAADQSGQSSPGGGGQ